MVITFASDQEGVGKSTIAVNLAALRVLAGRRVQLIDLDPKKSSLEWSERRNREKVHPRISALDMEGRCLAENFEILPSDRNDVLIDTNWHDTDENRSVLELADCVVVPLRIDSDNLNSLKRMDHRLRAARQSNPDLWTLIVIVRALGMPSIRELDTIRHYVEIMPSASIAGTIIRERSSLKMSFADGLSIFEYREADPKAKSEMQDLNRALKARRINVPSLSRLQR